MANRFWVGGTDSWNATAGSKWALTSGGAGGEAVPTSADDVFFDGASGSVTVTVSAGANCLSLNFTGFTGTLAGSLNINVFGNFTLSSTMTWSHSGGLLFDSTTTGRTITTAGRSISSVVSFGQNQAGGGWTLQDAFTTTSSITVTRGTFTTNNYNVTASSLSSSNSNTRTINLGSSTVTLSGSNAVIAFATSSNLTFNAGTSQINLTSTTTPQILFGSTAGSGATFYNVAFTGAAATSYAVNGPSFIFNNLSCAAPSTAGVAQAVFYGPVTINGTLSTTGTAGNRRVWFRGVTYGIAQTLTINSAPSLTDADFRDIYVIGTAAPISGTRIGDLRGIRGITASTPKTVYWNLAGAQNWSANGWSDTSTGTPNTDFFPLAQDIATFTNAGSVTGTITMDAALPYTGTVDMSGRTSAMTIFVNDFTIYENWKFGSGVTQTAISSTLTFSGRKTQTITSAGKTFAAIGITIDSYGGSVELADALSIPNTLTVTNGTFDTKNYNVTAGSLSSSNSNVRTITLGSSTVTLSGASPIQFGTSTNLSFSAGTSSIVCSGGTDGTALFNIGASSLSFSSVSLTQTTGGIVVNFAGTGTYTFNSLSVNAPASAGIRGISFSGNIIVSSTLTCAGATAVRRIFLRSDTIGTTRTLTVGTLAADDCDFRDITIAGTAAGSSPTRAGDCGGNTGITFPAPKTVYWNLAGAQNWSATAWCPSSGGTPDINQFPLAQDTAVFDEAASSVTGTISFNQLWNIGTFDASLRTSAMTLSTSANAPIVYKNWLFGTGVTASFSASITVFSGRGTQTITSNGVAFGSAFTINSATGTVQLADALTINSARTLTLTSGTFDAVTYNVTTGAFSASAGGIKTLRMGSGTWTLTEAGNAWLASGANTTLYKGTANIVLSSTSPSDRTFSGGSRSYNKLTIGGATGSSRLYLSGSNTYSELASTKLVAHTISMGVDTHTFGAWTVTGTAGNVVTIESTPFIVIAGDRVSGVNYLALGTATISATSPGEFYAGANSTGGTNAILTAAPAPTTRYWRGGTGTWDATTTTNWSDTSGGLGGASVPTSADAVVFDTLSNATAYTVTCTATQLRCAALTFGGPLSGNVTWAGSAPIAMHGDVSLAATGITRTYTGAITLSGSSTGRTLTTNGVALASNITINGVGSEWALASAFDIGIGADFFITNGSIACGVYNFTARSISSDNGNSRTINFGSGTISLSGNTPINLGTTETSRAPLTVTAGTAQINFTSTTPTLSGNNQTFQNVAFTSTSAGTFTINGTNTFNNLSFTGITAAGLKVVSLTADQTINGTLTLSAGSNATMRTFVQSSTIGTTRTLTCAAVASLTDIDFRDITIAGAAAPVSGTRLGDCKGNSGITFDAAKTVYWAFATSASNWETNVGGIGGWSDSIGGTRNLIYFPLAQDTAVFPSSGFISGGTLTLGAAYNIGTIDMSDRTSNTMTLATGAQTPSIYGNWINGTGTTLTGTGAMTFAGRGSQTITSAGKTFTQGFTINTPSGSVTLQDAFTVNVTSTFTLTAGTLDANGYDVTLSNSSNAFGLSGTATRTLAIGSGTWTIAATGGTAFNATTSTNLTVTGTGTISLTAATAKSFQGGGISYSGITLNQGGAGALTITGNNTFKSITNTYSATGATNITIGTTTQTLTQPWTATGEAGRVLTVQGTSASSPGTLIFTGSGVAAAVDYLAVTGIRAYDLTNEWYAGPNSTNNGSLGWYFESGVVSISASISETSTASDAVAAFLTFLSSTSETATATDTVDAPGSTYNPSLSETATATDAITRGLTLLAQVADSLTSTDTVSVLMVFSASLLDTVTATDENSATGTFNPNLSETATATDLNGTANNTFNPNLFEISTGTDTIDTTATFNLSLADTVTGTDTSSTTGTFNPSLAESATATDAISSAFVFAGVIFESTTGTDAINANLAASSSLSETATGTDAPSTKATFTPNLSESATATDAPNTANNTFNPSLAETTTGTDSPAGNLAVTSAIAETATATDTTQSAIIFVGAIAESATATDLTASLAQFLAQVAETSTITDVTLVAPSVFGPQVQEAVTALDLVSTFGTFNVQFVDSATALDSVIGAFLWNLIDDNQNANWVTITTPQTPTWTSIDDSQSPGWQNINTV
jgi:hypothetical protein